MKNLIKSHARIAALLCGTILAGAGTAKADQVFADDVIVQGSLCVGLDCVNNESFGFSTIRLKENNTRIEFMDTSTSAGFPSNDWMITANDSASGGANYLAFDDITGGKQPFRVTAGAPTGSLWVDSTGRVGLRNTAPLLDLHITTSNTPAIRLEQNNAGGFTAQTWDVGGNEANFFVRDLTGGSRLPFRIRPGAPTSSIDVAASGNVGIGTASPYTKLSVVGVNNSLYAQFQNADISGSTGSGINFRPTAASGDVDAIIQAWKTGGTVSANLLLNRYGGFVGINEPTPTAQFHTTGGVRLASITGCGAGIQSDGSGNLSCIVSSRQFKTVTGDLSPNVALANVMSLRPQTGAYNNTPDVPEHWLIAEEVGAIDPALVGLNEGKPYVVKTQNIVADLVSVVQQQQARIEQLERKLQEKR